MIHVVVPSYNTPECLAQCLFSVEHQKFDEPFNVIVIDDASPDPEQSVVMRQWCEPRGWTHITNDQNLCAPYTIFQGIGASGARPDDVIVLLDGDDRLAANALDTISRIYAVSPDIWLTYGNYLPIPDQGHTLASDYPTLVRWNRDFRSHPKIRFNHPITFRRHLWDRLDEADLQDDHGAWFRAAYDVAIIIPMLEMAGPDRYVFCDEQMYLYNAANPLSECDTKPAEGDEVHRIVRSRPKKPML